LSAAPIIDLQTYDPNPSILPHSGAKWKVLPTIPNTDQANRGYVAMDFAPTKERREDEHEQKDTFVKTPNTYPPESAG
jgi:hypothetical protein